MMAKSISKDYACVRSHCQPSIMLCFTMYSIILYAFSAFLIFAIAVLHPIQIMPRNFFRSWLWSAHLLKSPLPKGTEHISHASPCAEDNDRNSLRVMPY